MALLYAALLIVSFALAGLGAWVATQSVAEEQIRERVSVEMRELDETFRDQGVAAVAPTIRLLTGRPGALEYRLSDSGGAVLAGNLPLPEPQMGWQYVVLPDPREAGRMDHFIILTQRVQGGLLLSVGDDLDHAESVRLAVLTAIFGVGGVALAFGLVTGALATSAGIRRMDALTATMLRVGGGDLSARTAARAQGGDDIDAIGRGVNDMLGQIDLLVANVRRVSTNIAHDMRTPLTHVRQELESAAASETMADVQQRIQRAQGKIDDVLRLFAAMLRLAEIESGSVRGRFTPVDLAAVLERVSDAYRPDVELSGRSLASGAFPRAIVQGDADLIAQAVSNLIENAMRHTPPGTAIGLSLFRTPEHIVIQVEDRGPGIAAEERLRVLKPFERLENSRTTPGAGLGLSIVNAVAKLHHARLVLDDAEPGLRASLEWPI